MRVVTVATKSDGYFPYLVQSCRRYGIKLDVLGWDTEWKGFNHRLHLIQEFLETLHDNEIVLFIDAYDVIFTRDIAMLEWEYKQKAADRVAIAVEDMRALSATAYNYVVFGRCTGKALNAGTYMGYVHLIKDMLRAVDSKKKHGDDQRAITDLCRKQSETFYLDEESAWFLVSGGDTLVHDAIQFVNGELTYHGKRPYLLHCPGNRDMTPYLAALGYDKPHKDPRRVGYHWYVFWHQLRQLIERSWSSTVGKVVWITLASYVLSVLSKSLRVRIKL